MKRLFRIMKFAAFQKLFLNKFFLLFFLFSFSAYGISLYAQQNTSEDILKKTGEDQYMLKEMTIDVAEKTITIPCTVNMNEGLIEVVMCRKEGKVHESLLVTNISPLEFQTALLLLGLDAVNEIPDDSTKIDPMSNFLNIETPGDSVLLFLAYISDGKTITLPIEDFIFDENSGKSLSPSTWLFRGASTHKSGHVMVDPELTMIATYHDMHALMELNALSKYNDELFYASKAMNLKIGEPVNLIVKVKK